MDRYKRLSLVEVLLVVFLLICFLANQSSADMEGFFVGLGVGYSRSQDDLSELLSGRPFPDDRKFIQMQAGYVSRGIGLYATSLNVDPMLGPMFVIDDKGYLSLLGWYSSSSDRLKLGMGAGAEIVPYLTYEFIVRYTSWRKSEDKEVSFALSVNLLFLSSF